MARVAYIRVSSQTQNVDRQLDGVPVDRSFTDKVSAKDVNRPALVELLGFVRDGDTVVVHSMDRLARNLEDLRRLVRDLTDRGVQVEFVKEALTFTGDDSPMATLLLSIMGSFAEFERALLKERQLEGIAQAKRRGVYKGRKKSLTEGQVVDIRQRIADGVPKATLARAYGVSRETLYQHLRNNHTTEHRVAVTVGEGSGDVD